MSDPKNLGVGDENESLLEMSSSLNSEGLLEAVGFAFVFFFTGFLLLTSLALFDVLLAEVAALTLLGPVSCGADLYEPKRKG